MLPKAPTKIPVKKKTPKEISLPPAHDWRTSDQDEINRRILRAREEKPRIRNLTPKHPVFSNFEVRSASGMDYEVEIRDLAQRRFVCTCTDFRINGLGTCKHVEAVLMHVEHVAKSAYRQALRRGSDRVDLVPDRERDTLRIERNKNLLPIKIRRQFEAAGVLSHPDIENALDKLRESVPPEVRFSVEITSWLEARRLARERKSMRRDYELGVQSGLHPTQETLVPLFPYQREGMLHLAFNERALLADEMGLGKTIQAIAACSLLHRLGKATRVLVVTPASLKTEWEEQIRRFTTLPYQLVFGPRRGRLAAYAHAPFFTLVNYEQMLGDSLDVNMHLKPDIVVLDEAQRIKNWNTKTAQAIKRLKSRYAFVLTGTPIENRIDELYSIVDFLNPEVLGPLFRFNREFYQFDDRGRPAEFSNLGKLRDRVAPLMLRRRKAQVETELPERTDRQYLVPLGELQKDPYREHEYEIVKLLSISKRRSLTQQERDKLMRELNMARMTCDTNYILDGKDKSSPKIEELDRILDELLADDDIKAVIFSEWVRMLELVRELCRKRGIAYAWHTGTVPQRKRRGEIQLFKSDPKCRVFLSTDSGGVGLNLQNASVVINCDMPWNPAKLEQRIARVWRKHQTRPVTVVNLVTQATIEERMLGTLASKRELADGVLDGKGDLSQLKLKGQSGEGFLSRLKQIITPAAQIPETAPPARPSNPCALFAERAAALLGKNLTACEERYPEEAPHTVLVAIVERDAASWKPRLEQLHAELFTGQDPLSPVRLEVIDRATVEAMRRLAEAGIVQITHRATRHLYPADNPPPLLNAEELARAQACRERAARKLKMARLLQAEKMDEEAREALLAAILETSRALAIEARLPEPVTPAAALTPPLSHAWGKARATLAAALNNSSASCSEALALLENLSHASSSSRF
ncbi:MAG: DEAD/DEAH box helicase [Methylacidiphilales bacterium]|nr:DEAD/DEAH box helicase [Candidatus Methylacidiphilales bacterium]